MTERQRGLVTVEQLRIAGITRGQLRSMVDLGTLWLVLPRVYGVGVPELDPLARMTAVCLHFAHDLALSNRSAVELWDLLPSSQSDPSTADLTSVTLVGRGLRPRDGIRIHRVSRLAAADVRLRHGLPVTAPARALIDLAADAPPREVEAALAAARVNGLVGDAELAEALERAPYRTGTERLQRILAGPVGGAITRSEFERELLRLIAEAHLPPPQVNARVNGYEVDSLWPAQRVIVEADSWAFHGDRGGFERDRERDRRHAAHGFRVIRVTWRQLAEHPAAVIAELAAALAQPASAPAHAASGGIGI